MRTETKERGYHSEEWGPYYRQRIHKKKKEKKKRSQLVTVYCLDNPSTTLVASKLNWNPPGSINWLKE